LHILETLKTTDTVTNTYKTRLRRLYERPTQNTYHLLNISAKGRVLSRV